MRSWLMLKDGNVFDGRSDELRPDTSVLMMGDEVVSLGDVNDLRALVPRGDTLVEVDARNKTVMPGLIDAHCHMSYGESHTQEEIDLYTSVELRTLIAAANARKVLSSGVTSISQPGGSYYIGVGLREGIRTGLIQGPHMFTAGRYITTSNGLVDYYPLSVGVPDSSIGVVANTLPEMLAEIRRQVKCGVDLIKLADSPYGQYQAFTNDELKRISELTHQLGVKVTIHARGSAEVKGAVEAGFDWIMHGNVMTDEVIELLAKSRIPLVPTLLLLANLADWGDLCGAPANQRDGCRRMLEKTADTLHRARKAGVVMLAGTDTGFAVSPYGEWHAREMELLMAYAGMSSAEALQSMTRLAARTVNGEGHVGEIAEGMRADLIIVNGDPLADLGVLVDKRNVETVIKDGVVIAFDKEDIVTRRAHPERVLTYTTSNLMYDVVYSGGRPTDVPPVVVWEPEDGKDLATELHRPRHLDSRAVVDL